MSYLVISRKYRPQEFDEVIGQEHIAKTLKNAIRLKRTAHAYLFTGPRGVGKTTTARILAKALNCQDGPTQTPCNKCTSCTEIKEGRSMDVIEIDGASNRGIDEIRELRENVKFSPAASRYKVYIIDEVHMLTDQAYNALLKTLEEPPAHIIFIFATTEPHKIPLTIISRCQRFNFKLVSINEVIKRLEFVAGKENLKITKEALGIIARSGGGSIRDSESILDQVVAFSGKEVNREQIIFILGIIPGEILDRASDLIIDKDAEQMLELVDKIVESGYSISQFVKDLLLYFRNILILKMNSKRTDVLSIEPSDAKLLTEKGKRLNNDRILWIIEQLNRAYQSIKYSDQPVIVAEMNLFKLCQPYVSIDEILSKLESEKQETGSEVSSKKTIERDTHGMANTEDREEEVRKDKKTEEFKVKPRLAPEKKHIKEDDPPPMPPIEEEKTITAGPAESSADTGEVRDSWNTFLDSVRTTRPSIYGYLSQSSSQKREGEMLNLYFPPKHRFAKEQIEKKKNILAPLVKKVWGADIRIKCSLEEKAGTDDEPKSLKKEKFMNPDELEELEPIIKRVEDIFEGQITNHTNPRRRHGGKS